MRFVADLHIHTISSGHAYSTVLENAKVAAERGLELMAITDHGPSMPGAPHAYHFSNQAAIPRELFGVRVLKGIEANIINRQGQLDLDDYRLGKLDIVLAGLHTGCSPYGSVAENTEMMINAIRNHWVDIIVHSGNPEYPINEEEVVQAAAEYGVAVEINNSSLTISRHGSKPHCDHIACLAKRFGAKMILGTDSHFAYSVGDFSAAEKLLAENGISVAMVLNTSIEKIWEHLNRHGDRR